MKKRLSRLDLVRRQLHQGLHSGVEAETPYLPWLMSSALQLVLQAALEQEIFEYRGRMLYARGPLQNRGLRNGYESKRLKTDYGVVHFDVPQLRETEKPYRSEI